MEAALNAPVNMAGGGLVPGPEDEYAEGGRVVRLAAGLGEAIRAYHGSPHKFDRFDISRIGSGEGNQAYGRGLYFAGNEEVARSYRDMLAPPSWTWRGQPVPKGGPGVIADALGVDRDTADAFSFLHGSDPGAVAAGLRSNGSGAYYVSPSLRREWERRGDIIETEAPHLRTGASPGSMYEVRLHADPARLLDYDRPLSELAPAAREALRYAGLDRAWRAEPSDSGRSWKVVTSGGWQTDEAPGFYRSEESARRKVDGFNARTTGQDVMPVSPDSAARMVEAGIPGLRYLDGSSRRAGEGSHNCVMFDDAPVEVVRRYARGGLAAPEPRCMAAGGLV